MNKNSLKENQPCLNDYPKGARKLIVTAEQLFGQHGIDNVSLRQIVSSAGQANNYAVQHHFGSKEGLIAAIFNIRMSALDTARAKHLEALKLKGVINVHSLIEAIMLPVLDAFDEKQRHLYADFIFQLFHRNKVNPGATVKADMPGYEGLAPAITELNQLLKNQFPDMPDGIFDTRYRFGAEIFLSGFSERKRVLHSKKDPYRGDQIFWDDMLNVVVSIFQTPSPKNLL